MNIVPCKSLPLLWDKNRNNKDFMHLTAGWLVQCMDYPAVQVFPLTVHWVYFLSFPHAVTMYKRDKKKWKDDVELREREKYFSFAWLSRFVLSNCSRISSSLDIWSWLRFCFSSRLHHMQTIRSLFLSLLFNMTYKHQRERVGPQPTTVKHAFPSLWNGFIVYCLKWIVG